jgi:hypothetical protein
MRSYRLPSLLAILAALCGCTWADAQPVGRLARANAQPIFRTVASIECMVLDADAVVIGKIVDVEPEQVGKPGECCSTVSVEETLKGKHQERLRIRLRRPATEPAAWKEQSARLLLVLAQGEPPTATQVIVLRAEDLGYLTADFTVLRKPEDVIRLARETARLPAERRSVERFHLIVPNETAAATRWKGDFTGHLSLTVPVDDRLQKRAQEYAKSDDYTRREEGIRILRFFKSEENIARVRVLLNDPGWAVSKRAEDNEGVEVRYYGIRQEAYDTLTGWGVTAKQPVVREERYRPEAVQVVDRSNGKVKDADLKDLAQFKSLQLLVLRNTNIGDAGLAHLAGLTTLQELALGGTKVTDAGLKHLAGLGKLRGLELGVTRVTDAGLKELTALAGLEHLYLNGGRVTDAGLKHLACMQNLAVLDLSRTKVTDDGLKQLAGFPSLKELYLEDAAVTDAGVAALLKVRPNLKIHR